VEILLLHPGGLGDIILSLPAIDLLREQYPAARFTIAANLDHVAPILSAYADNAVSLSTLPLHNLYADHELPPADSLFWKSFDRIISWTGWGDAAFIRKLKALHPDACVASWRPGPQEQRHVSRLFVDSLGPEIASGARAVPPRILLDSQSLNQGLAWLYERGWRNGDSPIALHPGAGSPTKRWPLDRFVLLAQRLVFEGRKKLLIIEGPAESGLATMIMKALPAGEAITAESLTLDILAAVIAHAETFVGNDSGIAHLAAALGIPSIVIFGPTLPHLWAPLGPHITVLRDSRGCEACALEGKIHTCLENITVEDVIRNL
jgi:ADP-heptose:LPS heptosyltransferase